MHLLKTFCNGELTGSGEYNYLHEALYAGNTALCDMGEPHCDEYEIRKDGLLLGFCMAEHVAKREAEQ